MGEGFHGGRDDDWPFPPLLPDVPQPLLFFVAMERALVDRGMEDVASVPECELVARRDRRIARVTAVMEIEDDMDVGYGRFIFGDLAVEMRNCALLF